MARRLTSRERFLAGTGVILAGVFLWRSWSGPDSPAQAAGAAHADARKDVAVGKVPVVHMDLLTRTVADYDPAGRDLFKYSVRPPSWAQVKQMKAAAEAAAKAQKEAEERARLAEIERQKQEAARQAELALHPPPPPPPQPPAVPFKFLGFVGPPNARIAALEQNDTTFVAKVGEVVQREFRIDEVKYESLVVSYVDPRFKGQVKELPLVTGK